MRCVGVDFGSKRIGIAISDPQRHFAFPADVLQAADSLDGCAHQVVEWTTAHEGTTLVVGLPLSMDGSDSAQTRLTRQFIAALEHQSPIPVVTQDERLSSAQADEWLAQRRPEPEGRRPRRRQSASGSANGRDALAAAAILQRFLDEGRSAEQPP